MKALRNIKAPRAQISIRWVPGNGWRIRQGEIKGTHHGTLDAAVADWNAKATRDAGQYLGAVSGGRIRSAGTGVGQFPLEGILVPELTGWKEAEKAFMDAIKSTGPDVRMGPWPWEETPAVGMVLDGDIKRDCQLAEMIHWHLEPGDTLTIGQPPIGGTTGGARPMQAPVAPSRASQGESSVRETVAREVAKGFEAGQRLAMESQEIGRGLRPGKTEKGAVINRQSPETRARYILQILSSAYGVSHCKARQSPTSDAWILEYVVLEDPSHPHHWPAERLRMLERAVQTGEPELVEGVCFEHGQAIEQAEARRNHQEPSDGHGPELSAKAQATADKLKASMPTGPERPPKMPAGLGGLLGGMIALAILGGLADEKG